VTASLIGLQLLLDAGLSVPAVSAMVQAAPGGNENFVDKSIKASNDVYTDPAKIHPLGD